MGIGLELLTTAEMAEADQLAPGLGVPSLVLMENAGRAVAEEAMRMVPPGARIAVLCGPGNNGGDGFVAARLLRQAGFATRVGLMIDVGSLRGDASTMAGRVGQAIEPLEAATWRDADLVIDALFGAGLSRDIEGAYGALIDRLSEEQRRARRPLLAVDVPSGLDGNTGAIRGRALQATRTVTFFRRKPGHLLLPGRMLCGVTVVAAIGIPDRIFDPDAHYAEPARFPASFEAIAPQTFANAPGAWRHCWPDLRLDGHKYTRGHAVVVSGGVEMSGAARLCARGALRIGAGLVTIAAPPDALMAHAAQLNATLLKAGTEPLVIESLLEDKRYTAVAIGPGLGRGGDALRQVMVVLGSGTAAVLDADAITVAAADPGALFRAITGMKRPVVLTPHEGEFKRLFPDAKGSKLDRARAAAELSGAVVLLKGPDTVIAAPDSRAAINENAPPTLATAGSGDVLAGFVTGLLAQGMAPFEATCAAVWLHGECANRFGPGLIAEDIPESLPGVLATLPAN